MATRTHTPPELRSADGDPPARSLRAAGMLGSPLPPRGDETLGAGGTPSLPPWPNRLQAWEYAVAGHHVRLDRGSPLIAADDNGLPIHGTLMGSPLWEAE